AEGELIIRRAKNAVESGLRSYGDFAVLYRTNAQSRAVEEACIRYGIPYRIVGGQRFYDRKEIKDIVAYLRLIYQPEDKSCFLRIVNVPTRGIGKTSLNNFLDWQTQSGLNLDQALARANEAGLTARAATALRAFGEMMTRLRELNEEATLPEL